MVPILGSGHGGNSGKLSDLCVFYGIVYSYTSLIALVLGPIIQVYMRVIKHGGE